MRASLNSFHLLKKSRDSNRTKLLLAVIFSYYLWLASNQNWSSLWPSKYTLSYSNEMARAFLHGQLSLMIEPPNELLELKDPYDPGANQNFRLHDASLFNNKYYFYFSPVISLIFQLPLRVITFHYFSEKLLVAILAFLTVVILAEASLQYISLQNNKLINMKTRNSVLMSATFFSCFPILLGRVLIYEAQIVTASFFLALGILSLVQKPDLSNISNRRLLFLGLVLSLAVASRPSHIVFALLISGFFTVQTINGKSNRNNKVRRMALFYSIPTMFMLILFWYNFIRFNSIFEFGTKYMLAGFNPQTITTFSPQFIPVGVFQYLFTLPRLSSEFPFFILETNFLSFPRTLFYDYEPVLGLFGLPIVVFSLPYLFFRKEFFSLPMLFNLKSILLISLLGEVIFLSCNVGSTMRYLGDFMPYFVILIAPMITSFTSSLNLHIFSTLTKYVFYFSVVEIFFLSLTGYNYWLQALQPNTWDFFSSVFNLPIRFIQIIFRT